MSLGVIHVHVQALSSGVDLVIKLVRPGSDDRLEIVVAELAVVKRVIARVDGISLIRRGPLDHNRAGWLIARIFLPKRDVGAVRDTGLNGPLIVDFRGRENSSLRVFGESIT